MPYEIKYIITDKEIDQFGDYVEDDDNHTEEKYKNARGLASSIRTHVLSDELKIEKKKLIDKLCSLIWEKNPIENGISIIDRMDRMSEIIRILRSDE